ncbi:MAG TPA: (2Fe-2S) ferredoxin domain-containing protein [Firmicutes bacterium]|nr:(2Fe-2S) ferredoxin domain-containing protein [Bacillota bacterium]
MLALSVCVGSSCHLKGAYEVIKIFQRLIATYGLQDRVSLSATFCLGHCTEGVTVKAGEETITSVRPDTAEEVFVTRILPVAIGGQGKWA